MRRFFILSASKLRFALVVPMATAATVAIFGSAGAHANDLAPAVPASYDDVFENIVHEVKKRTVEISHRGQTEVYYPAYTYHMHYAYTREQINSFQDRPHGLGLGFGIRDENNNDHSLYAMVFENSVYEQQWAVGYLFQKNWHAINNTYVGLGVNACITARPNIFDGTPVPGLFPVATITSGSFTLGTVYVPGAVSYGNVLFFYLKWRSKKPL